MVLLFQKACEYTCKFISVHCVHVIGWNPPSLQIWINYSLIESTTAVDALVPSVARASVVMVKLFFSWNIVVSVPGGWINIKMPSYQYRKSHCGEKTILWQSYLQNGISYTGKMTSLFWIRAQKGLPGFISYRCDIVLYGYYLLLNPTGGSTMSETKWNIKI